MSSTLRALADSLATGLQSVTWGITSTTVERKNWANIDVDAMASPHRRARRWRDHGTGIGGVHAVGDRADTEHGVVKWT